MIHRRLVSSPAFFHWSNLWSSTAIADTGKADKGNNQKCGFGINCSVSPIEANANRSATVEKRRKPGGQLRERNRTAAWAGHELYRNRQLDGPRLARSSFPIFSTQWSASAVRYRTAHIEVLRAAVPFH
jgi:hypothetical protein